MFLMPEIPLTMTEKFTREIQEMFSGSHENGGVSYHNAQQIAQFFISLNMRIVALEEKVK